MNAVYTFGKKTISPAEIIKGKSTSMISLPTNVNEFYRNLRRARFTFAEGEAMSQEVRR